MGENGLQMPPLPCPKSIFNPSVIDGLPDVEVETLQTITFLGESGLGIPGVTDLQSLASGRVSPMSATECEVEETHPTLLRHLYYTLKAGVDFTESFAKSLSKYILISINITPANFRFYQ